MALVKPNPKSTLFYGWVLVIVLFFTFPMLFAWIFSANSIISARMFDTMGWQRTGTAYATAGVALMQAIYGPVLGNGAKKYGGVKRFMIIAGCLEIVGFLLLSFCPAPIVYYLGYVLIVGSGIGLASGLAHTLAIDPWFQQNKANAMAIMLASGGVFGFISPNLFNAITESLGWQWAWRMTGVFSALAIALIVIFLIDKPEDIGDVPDGHNYQPKPALIVEDPNKGAPLKRCKNSFAYYALVVNYSIKNGFYYVIIALMVLYLTDAGYSYAQAAFCLSMYSIVSAVGRVVVGIVPEKLFNTFRISVLSSVLYIVGFFGLAMQPSLLVCNILAGAMGFAMGSCFASYPVLLSRYFGSDNYKLISGTSQVWVYVCSAAAPTLCTLLYTSIGSYEKTWIAVGIVATLITIPTLFCRKIPNFKDAPAVEA